MLAYVGRVVIFLVVTCSGKGLELGDLVGQEMHGHRLVMFKRVF